MNIGIIVAMSKELAMLLPQMGDAVSTQADGYTFHTGHIGPHRVTAMQCGIGKVNAALGCRALIGEFAPDLIINTGVAGGTGSAARVLDVVVATSVAYHDVWCGPGTEPGQAADCPARFAADARVADMKSLRNMPGVKFGLVASGDVFVDSANTVKRILTLYPDAVGVDMESGALAQTCHKFGVPFVCLRVISDTPGEVADNGAQYESFWTAAPREAFDTVMHIISAL
ncbi:MAG: 5'-methylthioadenosine/adenosylhomocysteine nucleosidase [Muribaculaceae bacterium]|nr:5'-methylthioadenosine/adenosylhomocysteine nucleosidase [Muribaculaceae bacterium]